MKEHPILFSTSMVKAILSGQKTMTRRVIKNSLISPKFISGDWIETGNDDTRHFYLKCPYGKIDDLLWVRETFCILPEEPVRILFKEKDQRLFDLTKSNSKKPHLYQWKPSIHMFKKYARIWLKIKDIRVERLQDITEEDAMDEGITLPKFFDPQEEQPEPSLLFRGLWDSINKERGYGWDTNPWVWVIEYEKH